MLLLRGFEVRKLLSKNHVVLPVYTDVYIGDQNKPHVSIISKIVSR